MNHTHIFPKQNLKLRFSMLVCLILIFIFLRNINLFPCWCYVFRSYGAQLCSAMIYTPMRHNMNLRKRSLRNMLSWLPTPRDIIHSTHHESAELFNAQIQSTILSLFIVALHTVHSARHHYEKLRYVTHSAQHDFFTVYNLFHSYSCCAA
jgi:hypothetical protein